MSKKGFSVVELMVVVALIGIIVSITAGITLSSKDRWNLREDARQITAAIHQVRQQAAKENRMARISFTNSRFTIFFLNAGLWEPVKSGDFGKKTTCTKTPNDNAGFVVTPTGIILNPDTMALYGLQTLTLTSPRGAQNDTITITVSPYGGINVQRDFK